MTKLSWLAVSFYTIDTPYAEEAQKLEASLCKLSIPFHIYAVPNKGSWRENACYKSETILKALEAHPGVDIVFMDSDEIVKEYPILFDALSSGHKYDIGIVRWPPVIFRSELDAATIWIKNNNVARNVVSLWDSLGRKEKNIRHQKSLDAAINTLNENGLPIRVFNLPFEYARAVGRKVGRKDKAIIEHCQASLKYKKEIDGHD